MFFFVDQSGTPQTCCQHRTQLAHFIQRREHQTLRGSTHAQGMLYRKSTLLGTLNITGTPQLLLVIKYFWFSIKKKIIPV